MYVSIELPRLYGHENCGRTVDKGGNPGDVRRCEHARIMYCFQRGGVRGSTGYGNMHSFWYELGPIFTPIRYRRAKRALGAK